MPADDEPDLPSTLERSSEKAQRTYAETLESAEETYEGDEARAHRTAWSAVKHSFEKVGDHWEAKGEKGPSDEQSERTGAAARRGDGASYGGVDERGSTKDELLDKARDLDVEGRSTMTKAELAEALQKENDKATAAAREKG